jgi:hypothetical protein
MFRPSKFIVTSAKPNEVTGEAEVVGKWVGEEYVPTNLRAWVANQKRHTNDQNILEGRRLNVMQTCGYQGGRNRDYSGVLLRSLKHYDCGCQTCQKSPARILTDHITLYLDMFGHRHTPREFYRADFCMFSYNRPTEFIEKVKAAGEAAAVFRDRFNRDPRTVKTNQYLAARGVPMVVGDYGTSRPQTPRIRKTELTWSLAEGFVEEPFFRDIENPMSDAERKQRSREIERLEAEQKIDSDSRGAAGPGRYMLEADEGTGLPVTGGCGPIELAEIAAAHECTSEGSNQEVNGRTIPTTTPTIKSNVTPCFRPDAHNPCKYLGLAEK